MSLMVNVIASATSSSVNASAIMEIVGASLTPVTVRTKLSTSVSMLSLTVTVIVEVPDKVATGVIVAVQLGAVPDQTILAIGINVVFDEVAVRNVELQERV